jgi:hypothetical protein
LLLDLELRVEIFRAEQLGSDSSSHEAEEL